VERAALARKVKGSTPFTPANFMKIKKFIKPIQIVTLWYVITKEGHEFNHLEVGFNPLLFCPTPLFATQKGWKNQKWQPKKAYLLFNYHVVIFYKKDGYEM
jgi:hypothetical protein